MAPGVCEYGVAARAVDSCVSVLFAVDLGEEGVKDFVGSAFSFEFIQPEAEITSEVKIAVETIRKTLIFRFLYDSIKLSRLTNELTCRRLDFL